MMREPSQLRRCSSLLRINQGIMLSLFTLTHCIIKMFAQIRSSFVAKQRRNLLAAACFKDQDIKGRVATACEDKEVILLQSMSLDEILPPRREEQLIGMLLYACVPCFAARCFQVNTSGPIEILGKLIWYALTGENIKSLLQN